MCALLGIWPEHISRCCNYRLQRDLSDRLWLANKREQMRCAPLLTASFIQQFRIISSWWTLAHWRGQVDHTWVTEKNIQHLQNTSVGCHIGHTLIPSAQFTYNNLLLYNWLPQLLTEKKRGGNNSVGRTTWTPRCNTDAGSSCQRGKVFFSQSQLSAQSDSLTVFAQPLCANACFDIWTQNVSMCVRVSECVCVCASEGVWVHACTHAATPTCMGKREWEIYSVKKTKTTK